MTETAAGVAELLRLGVGLAFVVALVVLAGWLARRRLGGQGAGALALEERLVLGRGSQVVVVRAGQRRLLLGVAEKTVSLVCELDEAEPEALAPFAAAEAGASPRRAGWGSFGALLAARLHARREEGS
jgi:flagellar biogenesis protein FliO